MSKYQHKDKANNSQCNISSLSYGTTTGPEYSKVDEAQEKDFKINDVKMLESLI